MKVIIASALATFSQIVLVAAHGGVTSWTVGGTTYPGWQPYNSGISAGHLAIECTKDANHHNNSRWTSYSWKAILFVQPHPQCRGPHDAL